MLKDEGQGYAVDITIQKTDDMTVVRVVGDIDSSSAPVAQEQIVPLAVEGAKILLDMAEVPYMSSAGLRVLLSTYRQAQRQNGSMVIACLADEIKDTMAITGFITFFTICDTVDEGFALLNGAKT